MKFKTSEEARAWDLYAAGISADSSVTRGDRVVEYADRMLEERRAREPDAYPGERLSCYSCGAWLPDKGMWTKEHHVPGCRGVKP